MLTHTFYCIIFVATHLVITHNMGKTLKTRLKITKEIPPREEFVLNIEVVSTYLHGRFDKLMDRFGLSASQYNVLRILKGVYPEGHARCEIAMRMIDRSPDITRLIDRLEKQGLVERVRTSEDRRMSITKITEKGIGIIEELNPLLQNEHNQLTKELTEEECRMLSGLLEKIYENEVNELHEMQNE